MSNVDIVNHLANVLFSPTKSASVTTKYYLNTIPSPIPGVIKADSLTYYVIITIPHSKKKPLPKQRLLIWEQVATFAGVPITDHHKVYCFELILSKIYKTPYPNCLRHSRPLRKSKTKGQQILITKCVLFLLWT
jgi:hypothetical protein